MTMGAILEILFEKQKRLQVPPPESEQLTGHLSTPAPPPGGVSPWSPEPHSGPRNSLARLCVSKPDVNRGEVSHQTEQA